MERDLDMHDLNHLSYLVQVDLLDRVVLRAVLVDHLAQAALRDHHLQYTINFKTCSLLKVKFISYYFLKKSKQLRVKSQYRRGVSMLGGKRVYAL